MGYDLRVLWLSSTTAACCGRPGCVITDALTRPGVLSSVMDQQPVPVSADTGHAAGGAWSPHPASTAAKPAAAPRPAIEHRAQVTVVPADGHAQRAAVMVPGDGGVEGAELLVKAFMEAASASPTANRTSLMIGLLPQGRPFMAA